MNVAIFGGTFDPIHNGHLAVARAARERYALKQVLFVPADAPPHKLKVPITPYRHRFAMVALATAGEKEFIASDLEARAEGEDRAPSYTYDTVKRARTMLKKSDRLFFLIGMDAFADIAKWYRPEDLLRAVEFIVVSRPGYSLADVATALPESMRPKQEVIKALKQQAATGEIVMPDYTIHLLGGMNERAAATTIRGAAAAKKVLGKSVPESVAEYIKKTQLYRRPTTPVPAGKLVAMPARRRGAEAEAE